MPPKADRDEENPPNEHTPLINQSVSIKQMEDEVEKSEERIFKTQGFWLLIGSVLLILLGAGAVELIEGWQYLTSLYVIVQIATTIGYGDFTVTSDTMKLFCAFYVLAVLIILSYSLNLFVAWMHESSVRKMRSYLRGAEAKYLMGGMKDGETPTPRDQHKFMKKIKKKYGKYNEFVVATILACLAIAFGTIFYATYEACTCSYGRSAIEGCKDETYEQCVATGGYKKSWVSSFYMSVITLTTVGFGDHSPRSKIGRAIGIVWMLVGVGFTANWLATLTDVFFQQEKEQLKVHTNLDEKLFRHIDKDGNGKLGRAEFWGYFLVKNGLVSKDDLELMDRHFDSLLAPGERDVTWEQIEKHQQLMNEDEE